MNRPGWRRFVSVEDDNSPSLIHSENHVEEMFQCFEGVEFSFKADAPAEGVGKLYITTGRILWIGDSEGSSSANSTKGKETTFKAFDFDIPYIILHAVTHDQATYNKPCLYCQLDAPEQFDEDDDEDGDDFGECFFAPVNADEATLLKLFDAFSEAAQRNPDLDGGEEGGLFSANENELIYNVDEVQLGSEEAMKLDHLESCFHVPTQFQQEGQSGGSGSVQGQFENVE